MASATGSTTQKHHHTTCCGCFGQRREKNEKANPLALRTPYPMTRSDASLTQKDIVDFAALVKVDELDEKLEQQNAEESISEEEVQTIEVVFSRIHGLKEKKNE